MASETKQEEKTATQSRLILFPFKLHDMLENAKKEGDEDIVAWLPDGLSFRVNKKEEFVNTICKFEKNMIHASLFVQISQSLSPSYFSILFSDKVL